MSNINDLTIKELVEMGAKVEVKFYWNKTIEDAIGKLKPFLADIQELESRKVGETSWVALNSESIEITAFYDGDSDE